MAKLFISYVRDDTEADTNALYQTLRGEFGEATIYKDVDNVPIGANWKESVRTAIEDSTAFLWVIGPAWTPSEAVALELQHATRRGIPVIPVLVRNAEITYATQQLTGDLIALAEINAVTLRHESWDRDTTPLLVRLRELGIGHFPSPRAAKLVDEDSASPTADVTPRAEMLESGPTLVVFRLVLQRQSHIIKLTSRPTNKIFVDGPRVKHRNGLIWTKFSVPSNSSDFQVRIRVSGIRLVLRELELDGQPIPVVPLR
jgi:hypothetical protein